MIAIAYMNTSKLSLSSRLVVTVRHIPNDGFGIIRLKANANESIKFNERKTKHC